MLLRESDPPSFEARWRPPFARHSGDMIGQLALAIGKGIHPHPKLGERISMAAEVAHGSCTDLSPSKKSTDFRQSA